MDDQSKVIDTYDPDILELIPHRPPMLLINRIVSIDSTHSSAMVSVSTKSSFFEDQKGVPSWIGLEYMGQTAALIAGHQRQQGQIAPHLGLLLGSRNFEASLDYFTEGAELLINCQQAAIVGESLVTFDCTILDNATREQLAKANLSVFRKPI